MAKKFIPDGDREFAEMAGRFSNTLLRDPSRYGIDPDFARAIADAVAVFHEAMKVNGKRLTRSIATVAAKDEARLAAERLIRRAGHLVRSNDQLTAVDRVNLNMRERPKRLRPRQCPQLAPVLSFVASKHGSLSTRGKHVIRIFDNVESMREAKPEGAARVELFVDLVAPNEKVPDWPGERHGGQTSYLRSYSRSPIEVEYPKSEVPMRVVYWGRWASPTGEVGPFSRTLAAPIEGMDWSKLQLPAPEEEVPEPRRLQQRVTITTARRELPDCVETIDRLEAESTHLLPDHTAEAA